MPKDKMQTLDSPVDYTSVPGVMRFHDQSKPTWFADHIDVVGDVRFFVLQPEQVVTVRPRLIGQGWRSASSITLPAPESADYREKRFVLLKLVQCCCRQPTGRPSLAFVGDAGFAKLQAIDDGRLVQLARQIVEFQEMFVPMPEASEGDGNPGPAGPVE